MTFVEIDAQGARALGNALREMAARTEATRREASVALHMADLASEVLVELSMVHDGFSTLSAGVLDKATLAERFLADPTAAAASLGAAPDALGQALTVLLGFAGPRDLRSILFGLPAAGTNAALDAALARLSTSLVPALLAGQRPDPATVDPTDLRLLALSLGIEHAGPPVTQDRRSDTEVFWNDFWADGRTVEQVLADPAKLLDWVAGTVELDRRLGLATELPRLGDVLSTIDFAAGRESGDLEQFVAATDAEFPAIAEWLPAFLVGEDTSLPTEDQVAQTLAFAARVGWPAAPEGQFTDAIAFLRANRVVASALLPTGFEGDPDPLAFFNGPGVTQLVALGRRSGVIDDAYIAGLAGLVDQVLPAIGLDPAQPLPADVTQQQQSQLFALVASQVPQSFARSPATQAQFIAALGFLRQSANGADLRQRLVGVVAGFRTLAVAGAPALTERQLVAAVGTQVVDALGRGRLRARSQRAVQRNPEFFLIARQWGVPGSRSEKLGKYKLSWTFNEFGELAALRRKKLSWLSRAWDTIKAIGKAIWDSWEDNPLKAIFQVGKLALGALSLVVPGLGVAAFALGIGEAVMHAADGDWVSAIGAGLGAFTAGATDIFGASPFPTALQESQAAFVKEILDPGTLDVLKNVKRVFDIGTSVVRLADAQSTVDAIGAGLGAAAHILGSGGQLLGQAGAETFDPALAQGLVRLGTTLRDVTGVVAPAAALAQGLAGENALLAFANGLSILSVGGRALASPFGVFSDVARGTDLLGEIDRDTRARLLALAQGAGVAAFVARAIDAADQGDAFRAGAALAAAVQELNDPNRTIIGDRAQIAQRIAAIGATLQSVFSTPNPNAVAKLAAATVLAQFQSLIDAVSTPPRLNARTEEQAAAAL